MRPGFLGVLPAHRRIVLNAIAADLADLAQVDMQTVLRQMNALAPSAENAAKVRDQGLRALDQADDAAEKAAAGSGEQQKRNVVRGHLEYYNDHEDELANGFADIKGWATQAFVLFNASAEVANQAIFWPSVLEALKEAPGLIGNVIGSAASGVGEGLGQGVLGLLKGLVSKPLGLAVVVTAGALLLRRRRKAAA